MTLASTSLAAYHTLDLPELELRVLEIIESFGVNGCAVDEILAKHPDIDYRTLTPRFAPLERKGMIFRAGDTRLGPSGRQQKVMRSIAFASVVPILPIEKKKNPFLAGMMFAAKVILKASNLDEAKSALVIELRKVAIK